MSTPDSKKGDIFSERLRAEMDARDLTQQDVANIAGVSRAAVSKWLAGTIPGAGEVFKLARAFNRPMEWFLESVPAETASDADKSTFHTAPQRMPAPKFLAAARALGLTSPKDWERLMDLSTNYRIVWTPTAKGFEMHCEPVSQAEPAPQKSSRTVLTTPSVSVTCASMPSELQELVAAARRLTQPRGMKARLAKALQVPMPRVSDWLAGKYLPSGERALSLRKWVRTQEAQQNQSPGSVSPPPGQQTQVRTSNEKKSKSGPPKP